MKRNRHPADRLAEVRAELRALKAEEADLRDSLLTRPEGDLIGDEYRAEVMDMKRQTLDKKKLATELGDRLPEFYRSEQFNLIKLKRK